MKTVTEKDMRKLSHRYQVMFAVFCAEQVLHLVSEDHRQNAIKAIEVTKKWLIGEASIEECKTAANAADAAYAAADAAYAAYAAANAADAAYATYAIASAAYAADAAAVAVAYAANVAAYATADRNHLIKKQWDYYKELLDLDTNFENLMVGK